MADLFHIAACLKGKVRGNRVICPGPEAAYKKGYKAKRNTLAVWLTEDGEGIRVHSTGEAWQGYRRLHGQRTFRLPWRIPSRGSLSAI